MKLWKGRELKIKGDKALLKHLEKRIADDKFSPDAAIGEINNPDASVGAQCSMFRTACAIRRECHRSEMSVLVHF